MWFFIDLGYYDVFLLGFVMIIINRGDNLVFFLDKVIYFDSKFVGIFDFNIKNKKVINYINVIIVWGVR